MSILLSTPTQITLLFLGLLALMIVSWQRLDWGICLVVLSLPLYLLKVKIGWLPSNVLEMMILVVFLVFLVRGLRGVRASRGFLVSSLLILLGVIIAALNSANLEVSAGILKGWFLAPMVFGLVVSEVIKSKKQLKNVLAALIMSGLGVAIIALGYFFRGQLTYDGRLAGFYLSANHLAMYLAPILIIGFGLWFLIEKKWLKGVLLAVNCLLLLVVYLTYSYGAWLGLLCAFVALLKKKFFIFFIFILLIAVLFFSQLGTEKFNNVLYSVRSSLQSRLMIWQTGLFLIKAHPILGIGPGMFQEYYLAYQEKFSQPYLEWAVPQPHNLFLAFWLQAGLLGLLGFLGLLAVFFKKALRSGQRLGSVLIAVMIYIIIHGLIDTTYWKNDLAVVFWVIIGLSVILSKLSKKPGFDKLVETRFQQTS